MAKLEWSIDGSDFKPTKGDTVPYTAYYNDGLMVLKLVGGVWTQVGAPNFTGGDVAAIDLKINAGVPYVSFLDSAHGEKASAMKFNGTSWVPVGGGFSAAVTDRLVIWRYGGASPVWTKVMSKLGLDPERDNYPSFAVSKGVPWRRPAREKGIN